MWQPSTFCLYIQPISKSYSTFSFVSGSFHLVQCLYYAKSSSFIHAVACINIVLRSLLRNNQNIPLKGSCIQKWGFGRWLNSEGSSFISGLINSWIYNLMALLQSDRVRASLTGVGMGVWPWGLYLGFNLFLLTLAYFLTAVRWTLFPAILFQHKVFTSPQA